MSAGLLGDPRFFGRAGPFSLRELAAAALAEPRGDDGLILTGVAPLQTAGPQDVSFLHNTRYAAELEATRAGAVVVNPALAPRVPADTAALVAADAHVAWARVARLFFPVPPPDPGIHPSAVVDPSAMVDPSCEIGPCAVIGPRAEIGPGCTIGPGAVIGAGVVLGEACRIGPLASISHALLGRRVYVYAGARIGQDGFGFAIAADGFITVPQLGRVVLEDEVEIGANSTVDRGSAADTVIGRGTRIDNLVQVAHGVRLGQACVLVAQCGIAGSAVLGQAVTLGAQSGVNGHIRIGDRARVGAQAGVMSDLPAGASVVGSPALPVREFFRNVAVLRRLARKDAPDASRTG